MNTGIKRSLIALSVAAAFALPATAAFAGEGYHHHKNSNSDATSINTQKDINVDGFVFIGGYVPVNGDAEAVIHDGQGSAFNDTTNVGSRNSASMGDNAAQNATGNVQLNVTAGDSNVQANEAALAASDASDVFSMAQVYNKQNTFGNDTTNRGASNNASLSGNVMSGAAGNLNVNVAAGDNNLQKNAMSASAATRSSAAAIASIDNSQFTAGNSVGNYGLLTTKQGKTYVDGLSLTLKGNFAGKTDQYGNQYLDQWKGETHPGGDNIGHVDVDNQIQGAQDRPVGSTLNSDGTINTDPQNLKDGTGVSSGGGLSFNTAGQIALSGTISGALPTTTYIWQHTTNTAGISGSVLSGAAGNIGVNVASGSNNLQSNILTMAVTQAASGSGGGGGPEQ